MQGRERGRGQTPIIQKNDFGRALPVNCGSREQVSFCQALEQKLEKGLTGWAKCGKMLLVDIPHRVYARRISAMPTQTQIRDLVPSRASVQKHSTKVECFFFYRVSETTSFRKRQPRLCGHPRSPGGREGETSLRRAQRLRRGAYPLGACGTEHQGIAGQGSATVPRCAVKPPPPPHKALKHSREALEPQSREKAGPGVRPAPQRASARGA